MFGLHFRVGIAVEPLIFKNDMHPFSGVPAPKVTSMSCPAVFYHVLPSFIMCFTHICPSVPMISYDLPNKT